jgi:hypothetical protein
MTVTACCNERLVTHCASSDIVCDRCWWVISASDLWPGCCDWDDNQGQLQRYINTSPTMQPNWHRGSVSRILCGRTCVRTTTLCPSVPADLCPGRPPHLLVLTLQCRQECTTTRNAQHRDDGQPGACAGVAPQTTSNTQRQPCTHCSAH